MERDRSQFETSVESAVPEIVRPASFERDNHYYTRVLNAQIHPLAAFFLTLNQQRIVSRYCHLNPRVDPSALQEVLSYQPKYFRWGGSDLIHATTAAGNRRMVVLETNSSPSGNKSMPLFVDHDEQGSYRRLVESVFAPAIKKHRLKKGRIAVLYDKNYMETRGYAAAFADFFGEDIYLIPCFESGASQLIRFKDNVMEIRFKEDSQEWEPVRAALRYVTQKPWQRIPLYSRTLFLNPVVSCLAGGRNKLVAALAYELSNAELSSAGLEIFTPETVRDVSKHEIPLVVQTFGGTAFVKVPYGNAGQGVYPITSKQQLEQFMERDYSYNKFIVQSLIGNYEWSSDSPKGKYYHVGTVPNSKNAIYVADLRIMTGATKSGFAPFAVYARRTRAPLTRHLDDQSDTFGMLVTNLSEKLGTDSWTTDRSRLLLLDRRDFNTLGLGLDALITGYIQTVLAIRAIDRMACSLVNAKGRFRMKLFRSINDDPVLQQEILKDGSGKNDRERSVQVDHYQSENSE